MPVSTRFPLAALALLGGLALPAHLSAAEHQGGPPPGTGAAEAAGLGEDGGERPHGQAAHGADHGQPRPQEDDHPGGHGHGGGGHDPAGHANADARPGQDADTSDDGERPHGSGKAGGHGKAGRNPCADDKPGNGYGDGNHIHDGPPGKVGNGHGRREER